MLIVMRILASGAGCAVTPLGAAVVAEIWDVAEKGRAMSVYYIGDPDGPDPWPGLGRSAGSALALARNTLVPGRVRRSRLCADPDVLAGHYER